MVPRAPHQGPKKRPRVRRRLPTSRLESKLQAKWAFRERNFRQTSPARRADGIDRIRNTCGALQPRAILGRAPERMGYRPEKRPPRARSSHGLECNQRRLPKDDILQGREAVSSSLNFHGIRNPRHRPRKSRWHFRNHSGFNWCLSAPRPSDHRQHWHQSENAPQNVDLRHLLRAVAQPRHLHSDSGSRRLQEVHYRSRKSRYSHHRHRGRHTPAWRNYLIHHGRCRNGPDQYRIRNGRHHHQPAPDHRCAVVQPQRARPRPDAAQRDGRRRHRKSGHHLQCHCARLQLERQWWTPWQLYVPSRRREQHGRQLRPDNGQFYSGNCPGIQHSNLGIFSRIQPNRRRSHQRHHQVRHQ